MWCMCSERDGLWTRDSNLAKLPRDEPNEPPRGDAKSHENSSIDARPAHRARSQPSQWQQATSVFGLDNILTLVGLKSVQPRLRKRGSSEHIDILSFLEDVGERWIVAWDYGDYELMVGEQSISIGIVDTSSVRKVLSHRWHPSIASSMGPIPKSLLHASFPEPTWVDFLNHFNNEKHSRRVVERMGFLYAEKPCRALYWEHGDSIEQMAEACTRSWMWQELSIGPQAHSYSSAEAVWLHLVVLTGEVEAFGLVEFYSISLQRAADTLELCRSGNFDACSDEVRRCKDGALYLLLVAVFRQVGHEYCQPLASAMVEEIGSDVAAVDGAAEASKILLWTICTVARCCEVVFKARGIANDTLERGIAGYQSMIGWKGLLASPRKASTAASKAAMDMLLESADRRKLQLSSAVANLANRNVTVLEDRLVASFGVICAKRGVKCDADAVSSIIDGADSVTVYGLSERDALGVQALMQRRVSMVIEAAVQTSHTFEDDVNGLLRSASTGTWIESCAADVTISGHGFGRCAVSNFAPAAAERLDVRRWCTAQEGAGVVSSYELRKGVLNNLSVAFDEGGVATIAPFASIDAASFRAWFRALAVVEGS